MGKREIKKQHKRLALLDAALQVFSDKGINSTSVQDITERSGVAKGTFYLYFKDKYDIRNKLVVYQSRKILKEAYEAMLSRNLQDLEEQLIFIADYVLSRLEEHQDLLILISKNLSWGIMKREFLADDSEDDAAFIRNFHALTEPYGIDPPESEIMLYLLVEMVSSACYSAILYREPCDLDTMRPYLFESVRRIIRQFEKTPSDTGSDGEMV